MILIVPFIVFITNSGVSENVSLDLPFVENEINIVDLDETEESIRLIIHIKNSSGIDTVVVTNLSEVYKNRINNFLVIEKGFSDITRTFNVTVQLNYTDIFLDSTIEESLTNYTGIVIAEYLEENDLPKGIMHPLNLEKNFIKREDISVQLEAFTTFVIIMMLTMVYLNISSNLIMNERSQKTLEILASIPISFTGILVAKMLTAVTLWLLHITAWMLAISTSLKVAIFSIILTLPLIIFIAAFGVGISTFSKTAEDTSLYTHIPYYILFLMFVPFSEAVQKFFLYFPFTSPMFLVKEMMVYTPAIEKFLLPFLSSLIGIGIIVWISQYIFKRRIIT